ncbi:MAG: DNA-processing protein DprA [Clostridia bacterium]|nr:DNA-processing protein DprA [Clostridia bacterium]
MYNLKQACIFLDSFPQFNTRHFHALIEKFGEPQNILNNFDSSYVKKILNQQLYTQIKSKLNEEYIKGLIENLKQKNINVINYKEKNFPQSLLQFDDLPFLLYTLGDVSLLSTPMIAVVGSRRCSHYGLGQTETIVKGLCKYGFTVVSGLADGIDTAANSTALACGKTIAVMAGGFDYIYPAVNRSLFKKIASCGLVISQYAPSFMTKPYMFPLRNRLMAALCSGVVVTEAGKKSGALITANMALELGRDLFVLPSNVNSPCGQGSNDLLKQVQGSIITGYEDILKYMGIKLREEKPETVDVNEEESKILKLLHCGNLNIDEIVQKSGISIGRVGAHLTILEIKGLIKKLPNNSFSL